MQDGKYSSYPVEFQGAGGVGETQEEWCPESRLSLHGQQCSWLLPLDEGFFGQFCNKGQQAWGKIQETINHWKMCLFHCLPIFCINVIRDQFSLNVDRILNTSSCLFTNKTLKFWNTRFAMLLVTIHLQVAWSNRTWRQRRLHNCSEQT